MVTRLKKMEEGQTEKDGAPISPMFET